MAPPVAVVESVGQVAARWRCRLGRAAWRRRMGPPSVRMMMPPMPLMVDLAPGSRYRSVPSSP
jgi:hypothetical protein